MYILITTGHAWKSKGVATLQIPYTWDAYNTHIFIQPCTYQWYYINVYFLAYTTDQNEHVHIIYYNMHAETHGDHIIK